MYIKEYTKNDRVYTEYYRNWYETFWEQFSTGFIYLGLGLFAIISAPFVTLWRIWHPVPISSGSRPLAK